MTGDSVSSPTAEASPTGRARRTRLTLSVALALTLAGTAACGSGGGAEPAEQRALGADEFLTITTYGEFGYDELIDEWNADHPDIQVKQTKVSVWDDWKNELNTLMQAGSGLPDVVAVGGDFMPALMVAPDKWADLSSDDLEGRWLDFKVDAVTTEDGKLVGYATDAGPEAICYRADLFEEAGLPTDREEVAAAMASWDDYLAMGKEFVAKSDAVWYDSSGSLAQALLNQVEFPFERADNTVDVENPELQEVWETVTANASTLSTGHAQWSDDWSAAFRNNAFATVPCPGWMRSNIRDNTGKQTGAAQWDVADVFPGGGANWGGSYLAVPESSEHQEQAKELAAWLTAPEQTVRIFEKYGSFPSQVAALEDPALTSATDPYFNDAPVGEIFANRAAAITVFSHKGPLYSDIYGKFFDAISRVDQGMSPDESWSSFVREVESLQ